MSSYALLKLPRLVLFRMASGKAKGSDGCLKWKVRLLILLLLSGLIGSLWVLYEVKESGSLGKKEKVQGILGRIQVSIEQFYLSNNNNNSQVQSLAMALDPLVQRMFSKCLDKSISHNSLGNDFSHALKLLYPEWDQSRCMRDCLRFHDQCSVLDESFSRESKISSSKDEVKLYAFPNSLTPSIVNNVVMLQETTSQRLAGKKIAKFLKKHY